MQPFRISLRGEDHLEFCVDHEAGTKDDARKEIQDLYPEASILSIHTLDELRSLEMDRYYHMQQIYDDPMFDDYAW